MFLSCCNSNTMFGISTVILIFCTSILSESAPILAARVALIVLVTSIVTIVTARSTAKIEALVASWTTRTHTLILRSTPRVSASVILASLVPHVSPLLILRRTLGTLLPRARIRIRVAPRRRGPTKLLLLVETTAVSTLVASTVTSVASTTGTSSIEIATVSTAITARTTSVSALVSTHRWSSPISTHHATVASRSTTHWWPHHSTRWETSSPGEHSSRTATRHHSGSSTTSERTSTSSHRTSSHKVSTSTFVKVLLLLSETFVFRISLACPVGAVMNCADNTGGKNLYVIAVYGIRGRLNRLPAACSGDMVLATVKKGKPELRKKVMPAVVIRQRKTFRRKDGQFIYFEDNAGVIVNNKGEMKGSAIAGPVAKECADLWPRIASNASSIA